MRLIAAVLFPVLAFSVCFAQQDKKAAPPPPEAATAKSTTAPTPAAPPANSLGLAVAQAMIARGIDENGPVGVAAEFPADVKRVYCITQIKGASTPVTIEHRWFLNETQIHSIQLPVKSMNWRTQSYKTIQPAMTGNWKVVVVLMPKEELLTTVNFTVK